MANTDSPGSGSPLSDIDSDAFTEDKFNRSRSHSIASTLSRADSDASATPSTSTPRHSGMPPAKRRRTGASTYDHATPLSSTLIPPRSPTGSISSDSSGSVPTSPSFAHLGPTHPLSTAYAAAQANPDNPEAADYVQVTRCQWTDCTDPEQGNMDNLVSHINDIHIPPRQKKYFCEWEGCNRKSMPHTSAYALKAHMRSHTKEKPFLCALPECDRSFTRSDALAKHMRTVHETEALRPSDPVPRGHTGGISTGAHGTNGTIKRIKLVMGGGANGEKRPSIISELPPLPTRSLILASRPHLKDEDVPLAPLLNDRNDDELQDAVDIDVIHFEVPVGPEYYPSDVYDNMDEFEKSLPPSQYFRLLRRQMHWAQQEDLQLRRELTDLRATTDDSNGNPIRKHGISLAQTNTDEKIGDEVRKEEWAVAENLLDKILKVEILRQSFKNDDLNRTNGSGVDEVEEPMDRELESALLDDSTNPWNLLNGSLERVDGMTM